MLIKILGGIVLCRLVSWLIARILPGRAGPGRLMAIYGATLLLLVLLQVAARAPLGTFSLSQTFVLLPGLLFWLCFDMATSRKKPRSSSGT